jgi:hypothetical protein
LSVFHKIPTLLFIMGMRLVRGAMVGGVDSTDGETHQYNVDAGAVPNPPASIQNGNQDGISRTSVEVKRSSLPAGLTGPSAATADDYLCDD